MADAAKNDKLRNWQERYEKAHSAYEPVLEYMDAREKIYQGDNRIREMVANQKVKKTHHVRNLAAEIIEAQVSSSIPMPKVTARRSQDEGKAQIIEDMLRNEIDRLPFRVINDLTERIVPIQGGVFYLVEWDSTQRTHTTDGELWLSALHPKQVIPQDGVLSGVEDMDYIFLLVPETKEYIRNRYGKNVDSETESAPEVRSANSSADDLVTMIVAYYRNSSGGIGRFSWVGETVIEDLEDYQAHRVDGAAADYEEIYNPITRADGSVIPGATLRQVPAGTAPEGVVARPADAYGFLEEYDEPTRVPYYKPDIYPVILQRNVSAHGKLLGDSDIDRIADQQNSSNRLEEKIIQKVIASGSIIGLPPNATLRVNDKDGRVSFNANPEELAQVKALDLEANISQDVAMLEQFYEEARQTIGITDSFQGRKDTTATSGKAKEFAAAQTAGRLDSKRVMKDAAYAAIFEAMFKFRLAYASEPRPVTAREPNGSVRYEEFNRYDFLEQDEAGEWYWNDRFIFGVDASSAMASNREAMWQETRMNLQSGAFGNPADPATLILFWSKMEALHYPGAGETRAYIEKIAQEQQAAAMAQQHAQMVQAMSPSAVPPEMPRGTTGGGETYG